MPSFNYVIETRGGCSQYVYSFEASVDKQITLELPEMRAHVPFFVSRAHENTLDTFYSYVRLNLPDILSGTNKVARVTSLDVEEDYSLTVAITAREGGSFYPDFCARFEIRCNDERPDVHFHVLEGENNYDVRVSSGAIRILEPEQVDKPTMLLTFSKKDFPRIFVTEIY